MPLSETANSQNSPSRRASTRTTGAASGRWNLSPLPNRLSSSWRSSAGSPCTAGRSPTTISPSSSARVDLQLRRRGQARSRAGPPARSRRRAADAGEGEQVVDQALHALRAVDGEADVLVGPLVELAAVAPLQELAEAGDLAQRLLQVVARDVGELLEVAVGPLQVAGLLVEPLVDLLEQVDLVGDVHAASRRRPRRARRSPAGPLGADLPVHVARHHVAHLVGERRDRVAGRRGAGPRRRRRGRRRSPRRSQIPTQRSAAAALLSRSRAATRSASRTAVQVALRARGGVEQRLADRRVGQPTERSAAAITGSA